MSQLTEFYRGKVHDSEGRSLEQVWAFDHEAWEANHDFIQWLFPLRVASRFNPNAPLLTDADVAEFRKDSLLRENLRRSLILFFDFLGLRWEEGRVEKSGAFSRRGVFKAPNHNWLRITRALTSLRMLGLEDASQSFFVGLRDLYEEAGSSITQEAFEYWAQAATGAVVR